MLKAVGSMLLLSGCLWMGMLKVKQMDKRIKMLQSMLCALEIMEREMSFCMPLLEDMLILAARSTEGAIRDFLSLCSCELKNDSGVPFSEIWDRAAREHLTALKENDLEHVLMLGSILGRYDSDGQQHALHKAHIALQQTFLNAVSDRKSQGKLYKTLSATLGVFLVILFL